MNIRTAPLILAVGLFLLNAAAAELRPIPLSPAAAAAATGDLALSASQSPAAQASDPTLISVPTNTLGPGLPLWIRRDRDRSEARLTTAQAEYAEARADLARVEAQRAADDRYYSSGDSFVIYGPHQPGLSRALLNRPLIPRPIARPIAQSTGQTTGGINDPDPFAAAQFRFFNAASPPIAPIINAQLEAQRRFGAAATPPIAEPQRQRDDAVLKARKAN